MESTTYEFSGLSVLHALCIIGELRKFHALSSFGRREAFVLWNSGLILYTTRMVAMVAADHQMRKKSIWTVTALRTLDAVANRNA
jgi:hypothetical protein